MAMSGRTIWPVLVLALLLAAACGDGLVPGSSGSAGEVRLTDPRQVPTATPWATPPPVIYLEGTPSAGSATPGAGGACGDEYVVQPGDVPVTIAERCGVTLEALLGANPGLDPTALRPGDRLRIPRR